MKNSSCKNYNVSERKSHVFLWWQLLSFYWRGRRFFLAWASASSTGMNHVSFSIAIKNTIRLLVLDWGLSFDPKRESGRFICLWAAEHWIPAVFPSCETHTTRPILLHRGHFAWSPTVTMCLLPPSSCCRCKVSFQFSFLTCKWRAQMIYIFGNF